jgi:hypothetical protein
MPDDVTAETHLGTILEATAALTPMDITDDATVNDLGFRLYAVDTILAAFEEKHAELVQALADTMESDRVEVPHVGVIHREWKPGSATWNSESVRRDVLSRVVARVALDPATGEIDPVRKFAAQETFTWLARTWGLNAPKYGRDSGLRELGLNVDNYRSYGGGKWAVSVQGMEDGDGR